MSRLSDVYAQDYQAFTRDVRIRFPLLADCYPSGMVAQLYGVYRRYQGVSARALFVLDRLGIVRYSQVYPDHLNPGVDGILTALENMASGSEGREEGRHTQA